MATAQLTAVVETKGVEKSTRELKLINKAANDAEMSTDDLSKSFNRLGEQSKKLGRGLASVAKISAAVAAAVTAGSIAVAKSNKETALLASQARTTVADFKALAFAVEQYGLNAEQIADISKDVADKVGEFATAGTGAFQDYADVVGLTKDEAQELAQSFAGLSSQEVIGRVVAGLESVNATADQTTFVLESLGNDLSRVGALFANNNKELNTAKARYNDINAALAITASESKALAELNTEFDLLTSSLGNAATAITSTLAPVLNDFFSSITNTVPDATQAVVDFINSFLDAENITAVAGVQRQIEASVEKITELEEKLNGTRVRGAPVIRENLRAERERKAELEAQLTLLQQQNEKLEAPIRQSSGSITAEGGTTPILPASVAESDVENIVLFNEKLSETQLLAESIGQTFSDQVAGGLVDAITAGESFTDSLLNTVKNISNAVAEAIISQYIQQNVVDSLISASFIKSKTAETQSTVAQAGLNAFAAAAATPIIGPSIAPGAAAAATAAAQSLAIPVVTAAAAREQGGQLSAGQSSTFAERGELEILTPSSSSRVRTRQQMQQIMGEGGTTVNLTVIDQSTGEKTFEESVNEEGDTVLLIRSVVSSDIANANSDISKSISGNTNATRRR